jgi:hypothetical protein
MTFKQLFEMWLRENDYGMKMPKYTGEIENVAYLFRRDYEEASCIPDVSRMNHDLLEGQYIIIRAGGGASGNPYRFAIYDKATHWKRYLTEIECKNLQLDMRTGRSAWIPFIHANGDARYLSIRDKSDKVAAEFRAACFEYCQSLKPIIHRYTSEGRQAKTFYNEYIKSPAWAAKRRQVLIRDNYRCFDCGTSTRLQVHHITYKHLGNEPLEDLITLCTDCHTQRHDESRGMTS